jgi:hypothetical protein
MTLRLKSADAFDRPSIQSCIHPKAVLRSRASPG